MLALALLIALDIGLPQTGDMPAAHVFAFVADEPTCGSESFATLIASSMRSVIENETARALPVASTWGDAAKRVTEAHADVVVLAPSTAQLALERGAFMTLMHAQLDAMRVAAPKAWIVLAAPELKSAREWLNAVVHKRGDGRLSFVVYGAAGAPTTPHCAGRAETVAREIKSRLE